MSNLPLILASASPRRAHLLEHLGINFKIHAPGIDEIEHLEEDQTPQDFVLENARMKALHQVAHFPNQWILAADTIVALDNTVYGKPKDLDEAKTTLQTLSGKQHDVYTGIFLIKDSQGLVIEHCEKSSVIFKTLTPEIIQEYHQKVDPHDRAGAYSITDFPELILDSFSGSYNNIIGLPTEFIEEISPKLNLPLVEKK